MGDEERSELKALFKQAADVASVVPDEMRAAAFVEALSILRGADKGESTGGALSTPAHRHSTRRGVVEKDQDAVESLMRDMDRTRYPEIRPGGKVLDRALRLLRIANEEFGFDGLTAPQIAHVLTEKFRVPTKEAAVRMALGPAGSLVDRRQHGRAFIYRIMEPGERYLDAQTTGAVQPPRKRRARHGRGSPNRGPQRAPGTKGDDETVVAEDDLTVANRPPESTGKKPRTSRPGPKSLLESLATDGFFDSPRRMNDVLEHVAKALAYTYRNTDLSPAFVRLVRDGKLRRERDENGQYQYQRA